MSTAVRLEPSADSVQDHSHPLLQFGLQRRVLIEVLTSARSRTQGPSGRQAKALDTLPSLPPERVWPRTGKDDCLPE